MNIARPFYWLTGLMLVLAPWVSARAADAEPQPTPSAAELVARVIADEAKVDSLTSFYVRLAGEWKIPPETIAYRQAKYKAEHPNEEADAARERLLSADLTVEVEVAFDARRVRGLDRLRDSQVLSEDLQVFDGRQAIRYQKTLSQEYYALDTAAERFDIYFGQMAWPKVGSHRFSFSKPELPKQGRYQLNRRPQDYALKGVVDFAGRSCYVLENGAAMRRLHVGVDDRRLRGLTELYLPAQTDLSPSISKAAGRAIADDAEYKAWVHALTDDERAQYEARLDAELLVLMQPLHEFILDDYRELASDFWFPASQTYVSHDRDDRGIDFQSSKHLHLVESKINEPLADSLFTIALKDGLPVYDWGHDPPLFYTQKADRTPKEWQQIIDKRMREEEAPRRHKAARDVLVGQPAPNFPHAAWVNSGPLTLAWLRGKIVVLDFWATWCPACVADLLLAERAHQNRDDIDLVVIGVHPAGPTVTEIDAFAKKNRMSYPILIDSPASRKEITWGLLFDQLSVDSLPSSLLIDQNGKIAAHGSLPEMLAAAERLRLPVQKNGGKE